MDTKWKNIRILLSFIVFFLGVSLTLWNVSGLLRRMPDGDWISGGLLEEDYQQSGSFQGYISNRLEDFLDIAINGCPSGWNYYSYGGRGWSGDAVSFASANTDYGNGPLTEEIPSIAVEQDLTLVQGAADRYYKDWDYGGWDDDWEDDNWEEWLERNYPEAWWEWYDWGNGYYPTGWREWYGWDNPAFSEEQLTEEQRERLARQKERLTQTYFDSMAEDKNLLYSIFCDGELLYSNSDLLTADGSMQAPEGYNFLLYFDGEKVRIVKDGKEMDIYGDGYYRQESGGWYVPGYRNFPANDDMKRVVVCMAAAREPVAYVTGMDKNGGYRWQNNSLYWMQYDVMRTQRLLRGNLAGLAAGLALLFFSFFCRRGCREALERIARFQGKIWVECKALLLMAVLYAGFQWYFVEGYGNWLWQEAAYAYEYEGMTVFLEQYGSSLLDSLRYLPSLFWLLLFWAVYLTVNDLRHNKRVWRHGLVAKLCSIVSDRELKQPLARRMARRNAFLVGSVVLCGLLLLAGGLVFADRYGRYGADVWVICLPCALIVLCLLVAVCLVGARNMRAARDLDALSYRISEICGGNYSGSYGGGGNVPHSGGRAGGPAAENGDAAASDGTAGDGVTGGAADGNGTAANAGPADAAGAGGSTAVHAGMTGTTASGGSAVAGGSMDALYDGSGLGDTLAKLENIRQGMASAVDEQMKSERMKVELIANVSHDLKTPLTSIISYVQFLKDEKELPEHVRDYVKILDEKSQRLNNMVQDVFAVSKAASGELPMNMEKLDFGKLLRQTMADMDEEIRSSRVSFRTELPGEPVMIMADGQRMYRVFQNLFQNALKYSLDGSRVYVALRAEGQAAVASVKNTSHLELDEDENFTERFYRGDRSRTDGGSGLGLSIAQSFTEACGGQFELGFDADLFMVKVTFQICI